MNSTVPRARAPLAAIFAALLLPGCSNVLAPYYKDSPAPPGMTLAPYSGSTRVYASADVASDAARLARDGYAQIGVVFLQTSGQVTIDQVRDLSRGVGADIVVCSRISLRSRRAMLPFEPGAAGTPDSPNPYVHVEGSLTVFSGSYGGTASAGGPGMDLKGSVTSSGIPGISAGDLAAINSERCEFTATFWRRVRGGDPR